jgi:uncharacterized protein YndB with AHSA1/START domain
MELRFQVNTKIQKPVEEVFDAVYNPRKLTGYFTTGGSSGPLNEGTKVIWRFADYPGDAPITVKRMIRNELIVFEWESMERGYNTVVEMTFKSLNPNETLVTISESGWKQTQPGLDASYGNCQGWMNMVCCLKAFVEYGINLRKGAF